MNMYTLKSLVEQMNPGKTVEVGFDEFCVERYEVDLVEGKYNLQHSVQYNRAKVTVDGGEAAYVYIDSHREPKGFAQIKEKIQQASEFHVQPEFAKNHTEADIAELAGVDAQKAKSLRDEAIAKLPENQK